MADITLLDGSIGQELVKRSGDQATPLWSTRVMIDHPDLVAEVHRDYFSRGATVATTNTYAVHRSRLVRVGMEDHMPTLIDTALTQAERARAATGGGLRVHWGHCSLHIAPTLTRTLRMRLKSSPNLWP